MGRKRTTSCKRPKLTEKQSENTIKRKNPLSTIFQNEPQLNTPHQRSLPKTQFKSGKHLKPKPHNSSKKQFQNENNHRKKSSPHKSSSGKKHGRSKDYDSPSKDHEDLHYLLIEPSGKSTKREAHPDVDALLNIAKELLRNNQPKEAIQVLEKASKKQEIYQIEYLLGVCFLITEQYNNAIVIFKNLMKVGKKPKKNIFLLMSVCYKKLEDYANCQKILNLCLQKYPKFYEGHVYRGKLCIKIKKFKEATEDFETAIELQPQKQIGYVGKGDCDRSSEDYQSAIQFYNIALKIQPTPSLLLRRAICYLQLQRFDLAMSDIDRLLEADPENSQAMYFKGLIYNRKKNYNEAIICYEQAIKFNANRKAVTRSIYEIAKIKIQQRDYYEAFYTLSRAQYLDIDLKSLNKFKTFTDGVTSLMKKNFDKGIEILNELVKEHTLTKFLKPLFLSARAYGLMFLERFEDARSDLVRIQRQFSLDTPNLYNKYICEGILSCNAHKYEQALAYFSKAGKTRPNRLEPNFYKAVALIRFSSKLIPKEMAEKKKQYLQSAMKTVNKIDKIPENNPSLCLVKGLLKFSLGQIQESIDDFEHAITECTPPKAVSFYLKGLAYATMGRISDAANQLNNAIARDQKHQYPQIYLDRAKCILLLGEANKAFCDLQTYMTYKPSSPDIHIWAGHLLFFIGAYQDAAKAYSNINNIQKNPKVLLQRAKCYLAIKDVSSAVQDLKMILDVQSDVRTKFDYIMIEALRLCSEGQEYYEEALKMMKNAKQQSGLFGKIFVESDYKFYKGVLYFYLANYEKAIRNFEKSLKAKQSQNILGLSDQSQLYKLDFLNNGTYNIFEYHYNLAVCHILNGNLAKALKCLKNVIEKMQPDKIKLQIQNFIQYISNEMKNSLQGGKKPKDKEPSEAQFLPFPFQNRLCSIFPETSLPLSQKIQTRLYFCLPFISKPDISPCFNEKLLDDVDMRWIDIKPQAPWIRRTDQGVVFTDEVVAYDIELPKSEKDSQEQGEQEEEYEEEYQEHEEEGRRSEGGRRNGREIIDYEDDEEDEVEEVRPDPKKLKDFLKLDSGIEEKLAKLCKK